MGLSWKIAQPRYTSSTLLGWMSAPEKAKFYHAEPKKRPNEEGGTLAITFIIVYSTLFFYKTLGNCVKITSSNF